MAFSMRQYLTRCLSGWLDREPSESVLLSPGISLPQEAGDADETAQESEADWREAARARAICEAEDAGLRGTERQVFIADRTELYYAELESLLSDA
jgi:hypothetical protein